MADAPDLFCLACLRTQDADREDVFELVEGSCSRCGRYGATAAPLGLSLDRAPQAQLFA